MDRMDRTMPLGEEEEAAATALCSRFRTERCGYACHAEQSEESGTEAAGGGQPMGIGVSLFLIAVGAILAWAVEVSASGIDINMVGIILMIVGGLGLLLSLLFWSSFSPYGRGRQQTTVVRDREPL
jgi:Domain of unknown function (DUF6458)